MDWLNPQSYVDEIQGWFNPASTPLRDPSAPVDIGMEQELAVQLLKRANALRATSPSSHGGDYTPGKYGQYIMPWGDIISGAARTLQARSLESEARQSLKDLSEVKRSRTQRAAEMLPVTADGNVDISDKGKLLKWAVEAANTGDRNFDEVLPTALRSILAPESPFSSLGNGYVLDRKSGAVEIPPAVVEQKQEELSAKTAAEKEIIAEKLKADQALREKQLADRLEQDRAREQWKLEHQDPVLKQTRELNLKEAMRKEEVAAQGKPIDPKMEAGYGDLVNDYSNMIHLIESFKPEYSGSALKAVDRVLGNKLGETSRVISKGAPELASWWKDQERFHNIPERFKSFGMSLSPQEAEAWYNANPNEKDDPATVLKKYNIRKDIMLRKLRSVRESQFRSKRNVNQLDAFLEEYGVDLNTGSVHAKDIPPAGMAPAKEAPTGEATAKPARRFKVIGEM